jgi:hypothetical protein
MASDDESEGEEEVLETWKVTDTGKIMVVPKSCEPQIPQTVIRSSLNQESQSSPLVIANSQPGDPLNIDIEAPKMAQQQYPHQNKTLTAAPIAPRPSPSTSTAEPSPLKAIWYLGGNHIIKLLTSVDGDFDHQVLSMLASVPAVVGELALSVEALVSDDFTVGGFEDDLLAKIASNTLAAKRASMPLPVPEPVAQVEAPPQPIEAPMPECSQPSSVPNPLASYKPVPNPLARITPPGSPVAITAFVSEKRKEIPTTLALPAAKRARIELPVPGIQAR